MPNPTAPKNITKRTKRTQTTTKHTRTTTKHTQTTTTTTTTTATGTNYQFPFWAEYSKFFKTPIWLDDVAQRAFAGIQPFETDVERVQLIVKSLESSLQVATVMNKLDQTVAYAKAGKKADAQRTLDKAWAAFVGGNEDCGLWTVALKRANEFGTKETCEAAAAASAILKAFLAAQKAVAAGDAAAVQSARDAVQKNIIAVYMQAVITYAHEMYLDTQAKLPADEHQVEAYAFWRTIAPLVSAANKTAGEALDFWLFPGQPVTPDVDLKAARALGTAFDKYGLTVKDLGQYGRKQPDLGCKAYVAAATPGGILSTTDAKDSLRPADGAAAGAAKPSAAAAAAPKPAAAAAKPAGRRLRM